MKRTIAFILLICLYTTTSAAEGIEKLAEEYLELTKTKQRIEESVESYKESLVQRHPQWTAKEIDKLVKDQISWDAVKNDLTNVIKDEFTEKQLKKINEFYRSESGKFLIEKTESVSKQLLQANASHVKDLLAKISERKPTTEQVVQKLVETNKPKLPIAIDKITKMTDITAKGKSIEYHYAIAIESKDVKMDEFKEQMSKGTVQRVCGNKVVKDLLQDGLKVTHQYTSKDQKLLGSFKVAAKDCAS